MAETTVLAPHIVQTPGVRGGRPYVEGKGVAVAFVARMAHREKLPPEEIGRLFGLSPGEVHAALAYYFDHQADVDARDAEDAALEMQLRKETPARQPASRT